ncbi:MAG: mandelate racemase/muconate lactonizing enzyme family protein [Candidatus Latescibacterota bacterium]
MKITRIEKFVTAVPHIPSIQKSRPTDFRERPITLLKVHTDEGIYGLGEGGRGERFDGVEASWVGKEPLTLSLTTLDGAFAMAMYDIVGKALRVPAHRLMGTRHHSRVPVGYWSPPLEPRETAAMAEEGARAGFQTHKLKARPWNIVETANLMTRAAGPDYGIIVDPNFTFGDLHTSLRLAHQLEEYNVQAFEDPFQYLPGWHQYRDFRRHSRIPLAPHLYDSRAILGAIRAEAADMFNTGGSVETVLVNAGMAEAAGMPVWLQVVALGLGVCGAYATHVHAVVRNATIPSDCLHFTREDDLTGGALAPRAGHVEVPESPGLGVELDMRAVEKYRVG